MIARDQKLLYVYIAGMEHSGSTILTFLLNAHPQITSTGEVNVAHEILPVRWQNRRGTCSCGQHYYECFFWQRVLAGMAARGYGLNGKSFYWPDTGSSEEAGNQKILAFAEAVLDVSGASVFVDASKRADFVQPLLKNSLIDLRIINLYRDGRGIVNSWKKNNPKISIARLIRKWVAQEKARTKILREVPKERVYALKYEELCATPDEILQKLYRFIGVSSDVETIEGYKTKVEHHIVGNPMRLNQTETIRLDEKWRQQLSQRDLLTFRLLGSPQNRRNGYTQQ